MNQPQPSIEIASAITEYGGMAPLGDGRTRWYMPDDLRRFRGLTTEVTTSMVIAASTFRAMRLQGYPMFIDRHNIIIGDLDTDTELRQSHATVPDITEAIALARDNGSEKVFLVGDSTFYQSAFALVNRLHLTVVQGDHDTPEYFPDYTDNFTLTHEGPLQKEWTGVSHIFRQYIRSANMTT